MDVKMVLINFSILDNNLIDSIYSNIMSIEKDKLSLAGDDLLDE